MTAMAPSHLGGDEFQPKSAVVSQLHLAFELVNSSCNHGLFLPQFFIELVLLSLEQLKLLLQMRAVVQRFGRQTKSQDRSREHDEAAAHRSAFIRCTSDALSSCFAIVTLCASI